MAGRQKDRHTVAVVLWKRRWAEQAGRQELQSLRAQLEWGRRLEAQALQRLRQAEQALLLLHRPGPGCLLAGELQRQHQALCDKRQEVRALSAAHRQESQRVAQLLRQVEHAREHLLLAISRREAAEHKEALDRRDKQRFRARRAAALEEEAAERRRPGQG